MRSDVVSTSDLCQSSVCGHNNNGSLFWFKSSVQVREAFNVQHVNFINEQDSWNNLSSSFFSPLSYFLINLISNLWLDFSNVSREQCQKALSSWVNDINLMKSDSMNNLFSLMQLSLRTLHISLPASNSIKIAMPCKRSAQLGHLSTRLINCDDVSRLNFLFSNTLNHLLPKVVHSLHLCGLESDFASLGSWSGWLVDFNLKDLSFDDLSFFSNSDSYWFSKGLTKCFGFWHFERKYLRTWKHCKWNVFS